MRVENTSAWSFEQLSPYTARITALFRRLQEQFPDDVTAEMLVRECVTGNRILWLVLDGGDLKAVCTTKIQPTETGRKIAALMDLCGDDMKVWIDPVCDALQGWAAEIGADLMSVEGRGGWAPVMKRLGFREQARLWRKAA